VDAIVLAGGKAARLGGVDKGALVVGGRTLLEAALEATALVTVTVVVGPRRATSREVKWAREEPPGAGPVAAVAAGLEHTSSDLVAVIAVDLPHLSAEDLAALELLAAGCDGAIFADAGGRDQPLAGVYRSERLRTGLRRLPAIAGAPVQALVKDLDLARVENDLAARDCDTPEDLAIARATVKERWSTRSRSGSSS
jgi:molybdopterin-guanine dinucleotide biosynthesis protein A